MSERTDTIVIGAGSAGLASSYHLTQRRREHLVLERGRVAETWRTKRWDGFFLNTPNWATRLPGYEYAGDQPDAFPPLAEVIAYLDEYAAAIPAPVRTGVEVTKLRRENRRWTAEADGDTVEAQNVIVATGAYQRPFVPPLARGVPDDVFQAHTSDYRNPEQLPEGAVLIVGTGQSGCQIADELLDAGRRVFVSVGRCPWLPRRYRGREIMHWLSEIGFWDQTVDTLPDLSARLACNRPVSGNDGGHDCHPVGLERRGATLVGRLTDVRAGTASFASDLVEGLAKSTESVETLRRRIDDHVETAGLDVPEEALDLDVHAAPGPAALTLGAGGVAAIIWSTGYRPDFSWIDLPLFDGHGWPVQNRGMTAYPGLAFVGLHWLHKRKSSIFLGVGEDAEYVVSQL